MCQLAEKSDLNEKEQHTVAATLLYCDAQLPPWFDLKARDGYFCPLTLVRAF